MSFGIGPRCGSDPMFLWLRLWRRPAAVAPIRPLAWELPDAMGVALKKAIKKKTYFNNVIHILMFKSTAGKNLI